MHTARKHAPRAAAQAPSGDSASDRLSARLLAAIIVLCLFTATALLCGGAPLALASDHSNGKGRASWYGTTAHGKQTANGEIYNRYALTAAHKRLPFGTVLRVRNMKNGRNVLVRVNDRGPFVEGRVLDVSKRAADALKMTHSGVVPVSFEVVSNTRGEPLNPNNGFYVHIEDNPGVLKAREYMARMGRRWSLPLKILKRERENRPCFAVCAGPFPTFGEAQKQFLALERRMPLLGIIEGPARDDLFAPLLTATKLPPALARDDAATVQCMPGSVLQKTLVSMGPGLSLSPASPIKNGLLMLSIINDMVPSFTGGTPLFCLPCTVDLGYTYLPS